MILIGSGIALFATSAGITATVLQPRSPVSEIRNADTPRSPVERVCQTIATDPKPPLNVRSSPVVAPDNIITGLKNGTPLTVVGTNEGWLRISAPVEGWVYQKLTVTTCVNTPGSIATMRMADPADQAIRTLAEATELYHAGNLNGAIALAQTISFDSVSYDTARESVQHWQQDWQRAETQYYSAQKALGEGRWQDVLKQVEHFPANRFWRQKLTPLVKTAMQRQS